MALAAKFTFPELLPQNCHPPWQNLGSTPTGWVTKFTWTIVLLQALANLMILLWYVSQNQVKQNEVNWKCGKSVLWEMKALENMYFAEWKSAHRAERLDIF